MRAYKLTKVRTAKDQNWFATLDEAKTAGKEILMIWPEIELYEVRTDKVGVLALLNDGLEATLIKRWEFTKRGGLNELDPDPTDDNPEVE